MNQTPQRFAGLAGIVVLWVCISAALLQAHMSILADKPLSYLGINPATATLFNSSLIIASVCFLLFGYYLYRHFPTSPSFLVAFVGGQLCQIIVALVPVEGSGLQHTIHTDFGLVLGLSLPILIWRFALAQKKQPARRYAKIFSYIELLLCIIGVLLSRRTIGPLAEILAAVGFHAWIIWLTFAKPVHTLRS